MRNQHGGPGHGYDARDVRGRRRDRDESEESRGRHRRRRREEEPEDDRRERRDSQKSEKKGKKEGKRAEREDGGRRDGHGRDAGRDGHKGGGGSSERVIMEDRTPRDGRRVSATAAPPPVRKEPLSQPHKDEILVGKLQGHGAGCGGGGVPVGLGVGVVDAVQGRLSVEASPSIPNSKRAKTWREEVQDNEEDERDLSTDDEGAEKKLAEARGRREALAAKWASKKAEDGEGQGGDEALPAVSSAAIVSKIGGNEQHVGDVSDNAAACGDEAKKLDEGSKEEPVASGTQDTSMFDDSAQAGEELRKADNHQSANIGLTGASGDDWDDPEGYYIPKIGEVMDNRYLVVETASGKGVFSNVVKAKDQQDTEQGLVAIKIMRANDMMTKNAEKEIEILETLNKAEGDKKKTNVERHVVRLLSTFAYRRHFCLVFECMWDDLRAALKKYTKNKGMALQAVRTYTQQLFVGLRHMHNCKIIHADIKPDNILISKGHHVVKFCDLGTAVELKDVSVSPYLASRFYRAPEIILGCEYTQAVDTWALGCTLYELFTGKVLLSSKSNNDHLKKIMELKGKIPVKVIKKGAVWKNHFTEEVDFKHMVDDKGTGDPVIKTITNLAANKSIKDLIVERVGPEKRQSTTKEDQDYVKKATQFADLLDQMLALDPEKRIKPDDALIHPFLHDARRKPDTTK
eukprot:TRINITY_DN4446_c0_g1_i1.p1 TRINITY_DN4446_c0_g1~~TRINITY_DN4446_c0_g1_i1.p1  ORF type:complete len:687 (+),score=148.92 TRINITY_DN4446_c0_g1_i1:80-2140(+)